MLPGQSSHTTQTGCWQINMEWWITGEIRTNMEKTLLQHHCINHKYLISSWRRNCSYTTQSKKHTKAFRLGCWRLKPNSLKLNEAAFAKIRSLAWSSPLSPTDQFVAALVSTAGIKRSRVLSLLRVLMMWNFQAKRSHMLLSPSSRWEAVELGGPPSWHSMLGQIFSCLLL
jgi:hypothetical protein